MGKMTARDVEFAAAKWHAFQTLFKHTELGMKVGYSQHGEEFCEAVTAACDRLGDDDTLSAATVFNSNAVRVTSFLNDIVTKAACEIMAQAAKRNRGNN